MLTSPVPIHWHTASIVQPLSRGPGPLGFRNVPSFSGPSRLRGSCYRLPAGHEDCPSACWFSQPCSTNRNTAQSRPTLCYPVDCNLMGSSVHGILQTRILEWAAISSSRGSPWPRAWTQVSCKGGRFFTLWATRETLLIPLWISPSLKSLWLPLWAYFLLKLIAMTPAGITW